MLKPKNWTAFSDVQEKLDFLKENGLIPKSQNYIKQFFYSGLYADRPLPCLISGYCDKNTLVVQISGQLHCIRADYLQDMQTGHYRLPETYIVLDLETTGLDSKKDRILEFAGIRYFLGKQEETLALLIHPGCDIPPEAEKINGITNEMVASAPGLDEALPRIHAFLGETPLVAHNASFDLGFLKTAYRAAGLNLKNTVFDTLNLSKRAFPGQKSYSLSAMKQYLGIKTETAHRALPDVLATAALLSACAAALSTPVSPSGA